MELGQELNAAESQGSVPTSNSNRSYANAGSSVPFPFIFLEYKQPEGFLSLRMEYELCSISGMSRSLLLPHQPLLNSQYEIYTGRDIKQK
jgi:hypothetical protein